MTDHAAEYPAWDAARARAIADSMRTMPGACIPILHALQGAFGYIHAEAIPLVADVLNLSKAEVVGVVNFYSDFRQEPPPRRIVKVCLAEACQSMGSSGLVRSLESALGTSMGSTSPEGNVGLEPVYCLGNCALSPAVVIDGKLLGRMTPQRAVALVAEQNR